MAIEITREEADEIIKANLNGPKKLTVACFKGKWYDIRGLSDEELEKTLKEITQQ